MREKRIKNIYERSKNKKSRIEKGYNYWVAVFLGFGIAIVLFVIETINRFLVDSKSISPTHIIETIILFTMMIISQKNFQNRLLAIYLKEEKCRSFRKAKELLK